MQIAVQTDQLPVVQEVSSAMQIQDQKLVSLKGAVQTQTAIQTAIQTQIVIEIQKVVMHLCQWSTIMK